jgi:hypothetical protein
LLNPQQFHRKIVQLLLKPQVSSPQALVVGLAEFKILEID